MYSQFQLHIDRARNRVGAVGSNFTKAQLAIHGDRISHDWLHGIEAHAVVADRAGLRDDAFGQSAAKAFAAKLRAQVQAFHLADTGSQLVKRNAGRKFAVVFREQQAAVWGSVLAGKFREFFVETLKAEAETEGLGVFQE